MSRFTDTSRIAVTEDGEIDPKAVTPDTDVMYVRSRMDFGTLQRVKGAATASGHPDIGAWELALAQHNILDWAGPGFGGKPCNAKTIAELDPDDALLKQALRVIGERNRASEKKESGSTGPQNGPGEPA